VRTRKLRAGKTLCHRLVLCVPIVAGVATRFLLNRLYGAIRSVGEVMYGEDGERRHLTVLFCDLVDSPEIAAILPEEWQEIVAEYHHAAAAGNRALRWARRAVLDDG
jgi:hypothetical protein